MAIGANKLNKLGKRPVDQLDPDYLRAINDTRTGVTQANINAKYGYTPEEMTALNNQNAGLTNAGRYAARNFSGGSAGNALNMERSVINDSFGRGLQTQISSNALKMQKQQLANDRQMQLNDMLAHKQDLNNRLFNNTLSAWNQDQASGAGLMSAGLSNLIDANHYDRFKKQMADAQQNNQWTPPTLTQQ